MTIYQEMSASDETALRGRAAKGQAVIKNVNGLDVAMTPDEITARAAEVAAAQAAADAAAKLPKPVSALERLAALEAAAKAAKIM